MNLDYDFVQVSKLSEDQKKKVFSKTRTLFPQIPVRTKPNQLKIKKKVFSETGALFSPNSGEDQKKVFNKNGTLFSPNSSGHLRSDAHQRQIIRGMQMQTILKLLGGYSQIIGGIYPPIPPGFRHP